LSPERAADVSRFTPGRRRGRSWALRRALVAADLIGCVLALAAVQIFVVPFQARDIAIDGLMALGLVGWVLLARVYGLYDHDEIGMARSTADDLPGLLMLSTLATWLGILVLNVTGLSHPRLHVTATFWACSILFISAGRACARALLRSRLRHREPTIII